MTGVKTVSLYMRKGRFVYLLLHAVAWLLFFGLIVAASAFNKQVSAASVFAWNAILFYATFLFLFYLNKNLLIPKLYLKKRYVMYGVVMVSLFAGVALLRPFDNMINRSGRPEASIHRPPPRDMGDGRFRKGPGRGPLHWDIVSLFLFLTVSSASMALALFEQWRRTERRAAQAEIDKANAELSFLKAQVNPHFLFNTLNNIYALTVEKSDAAPHAVLKLSNLMRYFTDEANSELVPLAHELECVADYIALQQLRLNQKTTVAFTCTGNAVGLFIAPLLLIPFVENVFKYGVSNHLPSTIRIAITINQNNVHLYTQNQVMHTQNAERTGIGIQNTTQRLQHLYPQQHTLVLERGSNVFCVKLSINLSGNNTP